MAVEGPNASSNADGYFKEIYADNLENLVPEHSVIAQAIPFKEQEKLGDSYHMPVRVKRSQGVTFAGSGTGYTAFNLNDAISGVMKDTSISGSTYVGRETIAYKAVISATSKGKQAFGNIFDESVKDVLETASFYRELALLYGGGSIGEFSMGGTGLLEKDMTLTAASSSIGIWAQMEGGFIDVWNKGADGLPSTTMRNFISGTAETIEVTKASVASATGIVTLSLKASSTTAMDLIENGDLIVPRGAKVRDGTGVAGDGANEWFTGLEGILKNSGTFAGVSATTYPLWRANEVDVGGSAKLTMSKVQEAAALIVPRGGLGDLKLYVSVDTWRTLNDDIVALREFNEAGGVAELGARSLRYYGPNGTIDVVTHPMLKGGIAMLGDPKNAKRLGATDITFSLPSVSGQAPKFLRELSDKAGMEFRVLWDQCLLLPRPAAWCYIKGINNYAS